jgi:hypothetical protein
VRRGKGNIFVTGYETAQKTILSSFAALFLFSFAAAVETYSQQEETPPAKPKVVAPITPPSRPDPRPYPTPPRRRRAENEGPTPAEKSIRTDPKVNISLCVAEGKVRINGWDRDEIRAFVAGGSKVGFEVLRKKEQNPVWVRILGLDPTKDRRFGLDECLSGDVIEIDVPRGAVINELKGRETEIKIESVAKVVKLDNVGGNVSLSNITNGINATTYEGGVTVEKSSGPISLFATTGNIVAIDVNPNEVGEAFRAQTRSGLVILQSVGHVKTEVSSISGSIRFAGDFAAGGQYFFNTTSGSILLALPADVSCRVNATYGQGVLHSELTLKEVQKNQQPPVQKLTGILGAGEGNLNLTTFSGAIYIRKQ